MCCVRVPPSPPGRSVCGATLPHMEWRPHLVLWRRGGRKVLPRCGRAQHTHNSTARPPPPTINSTQPTHIQRRHNALRHTQQQQEDEALSSPSSRHPANSHRLPPYYPLVVSWPLVVSSPVPKPPWRPSSSGLCRAPSSRPSAHGAARSCASPAPSLWPEAARPGNHSPQPAPPSAQPQPHTSSSVCSSGRQAPSRRRTHHGGHHRRAAFADG